MSAMFRANMAALFSFLDIRPIVANIVIFGRLRGITLNTWCRQSRCIRPEYLVAVSGHWT